MRAKLPNGVFGHNTSCAKPVDAGVPRRPTKEVPHCNEWACVKGLLHERLCTSKVTVGLLANITLCPTPVVFDRVELWMELGEEMTFVPAVLNDLVEDVSEEMNK